MTPGGFTPISGTGELEARRPEAQTRFQQVNEWRSENRLELQTKSVSWLDAEEECWRRVIAQGQLGSASERL